METKKEFDQCPAAIDESKLWGFSWIEHVLAVPSPLVVVTGYKKNGKPNATMQSWLTFSGENGACCLFANVNKNGHMYASLKETGALVINFPSKEIFLKCMESVKHNGDDDDEIALSGLTAEPAGKVHAPRIKECFLNLECEYLWEKDLFPGSYNTAVCVRIVNICMDEAHYDTEKLGRYGETGYLFNIHSPRNPESGKTEETSVGIIQKYATYDQL